MIGKVDVREEETGFKRFMRPVLDFLKKDWARLILAIATFSVVSAVIYFSAKTTDPIASFALGEYEIGQIADKTITAPRNLPPTELYPVEIEEGEKIIRKGFPITQEMMEKLKKMADAPTVLNYRSVANSVFFLILVAALWVVLFSEQILGKRAEMRELVLECALFILTFFFASFAYKNVSFQSSFRIMPAIASTMSVFLVAILFGQRSAYLFAQILSFGILAATNFQLVPTLFTLATGLSGARIVRKIEKRIDIVFASLLQAVLSIVLVIVLKVIFDSSFGDIAFVLPGVAINSFLSGILVLGLLPPLEGIMNTASVFRLMDLNDTRTPALEKLQLEASGTFDHSMAVATLAERACKEIGANALLARVASYYHDIGKVENPEYFTENQDGKNKHDDLNPSLSASILKNHVKKGVEEAKRLHLPSQVVDIIAEHHGNSVMAWFYKKAKDLDPNANEVDFSYPGTPPISKESAVVMLADSAEAASRSLNEPSASRLEKFIQGLIDGKIAGHQLDRCGLTFGELSVIKESFVDVLAARYHSRVKYPNQKDPDEKTPKQKEAEQKPEPKQEQKSESKESPQRSENAESKEKSETAQSESADSAKSAENAETAESKEESETAQSESTDSANSEENAKIAESKKESETAQSESAEIANSEENAEIAESKEESETAQSESTDSAKSEENAKIAESKELKKKEDSAEK